MLLALKIILITVFCQSLTQVEEQNTIPINKNTAAESHFATNKIGSYEPRRTNKRNAKKFPEIKQNLTKCEENFVLSILKYTNFQENPHVTKPRSLFKDLIQKARVLLNLETLVLFTDPTMKSKNFQNVIYLKQDKIIITGTLDWQLRELFSGNILSIVFIDSEKLNRDLLNIFKQSLHRWHIKKALFVADDFIIKSNPVWSNLFYWLHEEGFWNSFLMDVYGNTLAMDHISAKLLYNSVSVEDFFRLSIMWPDLMGYPVRVSIANDPPRALVYRDKTNKTVYTGYYGSVINIFIKFYNATLIPFQISDMDYYHELDCLKYIEEQIVDVCGDAMALHPYSYHVLTNPDELSDSFLVVPYDKPLPRFYYFLKPFQWSMWGLLIVTFAYTIFALALINRVQNGSWSFAYQLQYAVLSLINMPFELRRIKGPLKTYLELLLIFKAFVVCNWYLSLLTSLLYTRLYSNDINSLEDLQRLNITIMVNAFEFSMLNATDLDPIITQQLLVVSDELLLEHRRNLNPQYAYYSQYDKNNFYLYQQKFLLHPRMKELTEAPLLAAMGGIPMRFNWPFEHLLNNVLICIIDTGLFKRLMAESSEDGIRSGYLKFFPTEHHSVEPLSLEYFELSGFILAVGYTLGLISFLFEVLVCKRIVKK